MVFYLWRLLSDNVFLTCHLSLNSSFPFDVLYFFLVAKLRPLNSSYSLLTINAFFPYTVNFPSWHRRFTDYIFVFFTTWSAFLISINHPRFSPCLDVLYKLSCVEFQVLLILSFFLAWFLFCTVASNAIYGWSLSIISSIILQSLI